MAVNEEIRADHYGEEDQSDVVLVNNAVVDSEHGIEQRCAASQHLFDYGNSAKVN